MARGKRPVSFRTRKLSLSAPMVLPWRRGGRVGRRRTTIPEGAPASVLGPLRHARHPATPHHVDYAQSPSATCSVHKSATARRSPRQRRARGSFVVAPTLSASQVFSARQLAPGGRGPRPGPAARAASRRVPSCGTRAATCAGAVPAARRPRSSRPAPGSASRPDLQPAAASRSTSACRRGPWTSSATARRYRATWSLSSRQLPAGDVQPVGRDLHVPGAGPRAVGVHHRALVGLVRRLVVAEPDVAVRAGTPSPSRTPARARRAAPCSGALTCAS